MEYVNKTAVMEMAFSILQPLSKILILSKLSHSEVTELIKQSFVASSYEYFDTPGKNMTYTNVSSLTGLNRKEVVRLLHCLVRKQSRENQEQLILTAQAHRLVHGWHVDSEYIDEEGQPKDIPLNGEKACFGSLSERYCDDIDAQLVLKELVRTKLIEKTEDNKLRFIGHEYKYIQNMLENVRLLSCSMSDLFGDASKVRVDNNGEISFSKNLIFSGIDGKVAHEFHEAASDKATELFEILHQIVSDERERQGLPLRKSNLKVGLGIYYFDDETEPKVVKIQSNSGK